MTKRNKSIKVNWENSAKTINVKKQLAYLKEYKRKIQEDYELYFHEEQNQVEIKQYYKLIQENDTLDLFYLYHDLVRLTHKNRIPYFISKDLYLYTWVDLRPDGTIKNIYSGEKKMAEWLIHQDHKIIIQRFEEYQQFLENLKQKQFDSIQQLKSIEQRLKLNTEHIVPQSWFGGLEPIKGDLHHLFSCDPSCNIARSNFPYADFTFYVPESPFNTIQNQCGVAQNGKFEPEYGKGIVARAMLYILLRYPKAIKESFRSQIDLPLLSRWNKEYKVSLFEKHRNQAIFRIQGNRNPFIDFPDLVGKIQFPID
jgi:deoxyribonuclease I